jgi:5-methylcytosine-specific restriction endonuclease McrA
MVSEKADVLLFHENWIVRSARWETQVPSVMMLHEYMKPKTTIRFSRVNVYLRDNCQCQYCGKYITRDESTVDHVLPISKGGKSTWENCTTACGPCNGAKGNDTHGWKPMIKPYKPDGFEMANKRKKMPFKLRHEEWRQFIV